MECKAVDIDITGLALGCFSVCLIRIDNALPVGVMERVSSFLFVRFPWFMAWQGWHNMVQVLVEVIVMRVQAWMCMSI